MRANTRYFDLVVFVILLIKNTSEGFQIRKVHDTACSTQRIVTTVDRTMPSGLVNFQSLAMSMSTSFSEENEEIEPGKMRVAEIKAELDLRGIDYSDCFEKESLMERLEEARATGRSNPDIIDKFNKQKLEETFKEKKVDVREEDIRQAVANDGTLPGGMTPDMFKKLTSNPEVMAMLQSTKVQEAMKLMMTGGKEQLEQKLKEDLELQKSIEKLNTVLRSVQ